MSDVPGVRESQLLEPTADLAASVDEAKAARDRKRASEDHSHLWSPVDETADGRPVYECVADGCPAQFVEESDGEHVEVAP